MTSDQEIFYDFCIFPLQLILLVLYFIYLLRTYSVICFPALSLWSRSISMAFNLILVGDSMNLERSCALIKGQEIKMRYNIVFLISYPFLEEETRGGGGDGWYLLAPLIPFYPLCHALYSYHSFGSWLDSIISSFAACLDLLQLLSVNTNKIGWGEFFLSFWAGE